MASIGVTLAIRKRETVKIKPATMLGGKGIFGGTLTKNKLPYAYL